MSLVVAARTERDGIVMACDSQVTDGYIKESVTDAKIWTDGVAIYGACGDLRTIEVIRYHTPQATADTSDPYESLVKGLVPLLQEQAKLHGTLTTADDGTWGFDAHLLVAWGNVLAMIDQTFAVMVPSTHRAAIGTGRDVALGYLGNRGVWVTQEVLKAARRSVEMSVNVSGPVYYVNSKQRTIWEA